MMKQGICRPSSNTWAAPIHMVLKRNIIHGDFVMTIVFLMQ